MTEVFKWFSPNFTEQAQKIKDWNIIANSGKMNISMQALELQGDLVQEEGKEVFAAYSEKDLEGFVKELCDLFVVTSYMTYLEYAFKDDVVKEDDLFTLTLQEGDRTPSKMLSNLSEALENNWGAAILNNTIGLLAALEGDGKSNLDKVIDNNYSKFVKIKNNEGAAIYDLTCVQLEAASKGRYINIKWEIVGDYIVYKDSKGKILKPLNFKELVL